MLNIISGVAQADSGSVICSRGLSVGYLSQGLLLTEGVTVYEEALSVFAQLIDMEREIEELAEAISDIPSRSESPNTDDLAGRLASLEERRVRGGYRFRSQTRRCYQVWGWERAGSLNRCPASAAERGSLEPGQALATEPDLLLLDEPTNHLDVSSVSGLSHSYQQ